jgi:hypothetical protein
MVVEKVEIIPHPVKTLELRDGLIRSCTILNGSRTVLHRVFEAETND